MPSFRGTDFDMLAEDAEGVGGAEWEATDYTAVRHVPGANGANSDVIFLLGVGAEVKVVRILLPDLASWDNMNSFRQELGTLVDYDGTSVANVLLEKLEKPYTLLDNRVLVTCTFRKTSGDN